MRVELRKKCQCKGALLRFVSHQSADQSNFIGMDPMKESLLFPWTTMRKFISSPKKSFSANRTGIGRRSTTLTGKT